MLALLLGLCAATCPAQLSKRALQLPVPHRWALVVGAGEYKHFPRLKFAASDAEMFSKSLVEDLTFDPQNVKTLTDSKGAEATTSVNIFKALDTILADRTLDQGNLFVFYFSGHGLGLPEGDFLVPTDAQDKDVARVGVPVKQLIARFVKAGLKSVLIVTDACRAGNRNTFGRELEGLSKKANIAVMQACSPGQVSIESGNLKHGIFTSYLVKNLKNAHLRGSLSGSLWASQVAQKTRKDVAEVTELEYGDGKQVPTVWSEPYRDVLVGSFFPGEYPSNTISRDLIVDAQKKGPRAYGELLRLLGVQYALTEDYLKATELLQSAESIGAITRWSRTVLALSLLSLNREVDATKIFKLLIDSGDSLERDQALYWTPDPLVTRPQKIEAALRLFRNDPNGKQPFDDLVSILSIMPLATGPDFNRLEQEVYAKFPRNSRKGLYTGGIVAFNRGDFVRARQLLLKAKTQEGVAPTVDQIDTVIYSVAEATADEETMDSLIAEKVKAESVEFWWLASLAERSQAKPLAERVKAATLLLDKGSHPELILTATHLLDLDLRLAAGIVRAHRAKFEGSLQLAIVEWAIEKASDGKGSYEFTTDLKAFPDEEGSIHMRCFDFLRVILLNQFKAEQIDRPTFQLRLAAAADIALSRPEGFRSNWTSGVFLVAAFQAMGREDQAVLVYHRYFKRAAEASSIPALPRYTWFLICTEGGDLDAARALYRTGNWGGKGSIAANIDIEWVNFLVSAGAMTEAKAQLARMGHITDPHQLNWINALKYAVEMSEKDVSHFEQLRDIVKLEANENMVLSSAWVAWSLAAANVSEEGDGPLSTYYNMFVDGFQSLPYRQGPPWQVRMLTIMGQIRSKITDRSNLSAKELPLIEPDLLLSPIAKDLPWSTPLDLKDRATVPCEWRIERMEGDQVVKGGYSIHSRKIKLRIDKKEFEAILSEQGWFELDLDPARGESNLVGRLLSNGTVTFALYDGLLRRTVYKPVLK